MSAQPAVDTTAYSPTIPPPTPLDEVTDGTLSIVGDHLTGDPAVLLWMQGVAASGRAW